MHQNNVNFVNFEHISFFFSVFIVDFKQINTRWVITFQQGIIFD